MILAATLLSSFLALSPNLAQASDDDLTGADILKMSFGSETPLDEGKKKAIYLLVHFKTLELHNQFFILDRLNEVATGPFGSKLRLEAFTPGLVQEVDYFENHYEDKLSAQYDRLPRLDSVDTIIKIMQNKALEFADAANSLMSSRDLHYYRAAEQVLTQVVLLAYKSTPNVDMGHLNRPNLHGQSFVFETFISYLTQIKNHEYFRFNYADLQFRHSSAEQVLFSIKNNLNQYLDGAVACEALFKPAPSPKAPPTDLPN